MYRMFWTENMGSASSRVCVIAGTRPSTFDLCPPPSPVGGPETVNIGEEGICPFVVKWVED